MVDQVLFDTSVLVAAFLTSHPKHRECLVWFREVKSDRLQGFLATHTFAETYSVLTRFPIKPKISPTLAKRLIQENLNKFQGIALTLEDYQAVIDRMVNLNLTGGAIYDGLIARAAEKADVDLILILNPNHFTRLGETIARRVRVPN